MRIVEEGWINKLRNLAWRFSDCAEICVIVPFGCGDIGCCAGNGKSAEWAALGCTALFLFNILCPHTVEGAHHHLNCYRKSHSTLTCLFSDISHNLTELCLNLWITHSEGTTRRANKMSVITQSVNLKCLNNRGGMIPQKRNCEPRFLEKNRFFLRN